jgi:hypothetical protein
VPSGIDRAGCRSMLICSNLALHGLLLCMSSTAKKGLPPEMYLRTVHRAVSQDCSSVAVPHSLRCDLGLKDCKREMQTCLFLA